MGLEAVQGLESAGSVLQSHPTVDLGLSRLADIRLSLERVAACLPVGDSIEHLETQVLHVKIFPLIPSRWNLQMPGGSGLRRSS